MSGVLQDLRYAARWLVRNPGFTALAIVTLGLGIGANTALFGVCETVLLRSLPVREPGRLVLFEWRAGEAFRTSGQRGPSTKTPPGTRGASIFRYDVFDRMRQARAAAPNGPQGLRPAVLGLLLGLGAALALGRTVASVVYGIQASDPATLTAVSALLLSIAALAAFIPARRAARVDPIVALRTE